MVSPTFTQGSNGCFPYLLTVTSAATIHTGNGTWKVTFFPEIILIFFKRTIPWYNSITLWYVTQFTIIQGRFYFLMEAEAGAALVYQLQDDMACLHGQTTSPANSANKGCFGQPVSSRWNRPWRCPEGPGVGNTMILALDSWDEHQRNDFHEPRLLNLSIERKALNCSTRDVRFVLSSNIFFFH